MPELSKKKGQILKAKTYKTGEPSTGTGGADIDQRRYDSLARVLDVRIHGKANPVVMAVTLHGNKLLIAGNSLNPAAVKEIEARLQLIRDVLLGEESVALAAKHIAKNSNFKYDRIEKDLLKLVNTYIGADETSPELREKLTACVDNAMRYENATLSMPGAVVHAEQAVVFYLMQDNSVHVYDYKVGTTRQCCQTCHEFLTKFGVGHRATHGGIYPNVYDPDTGKGLPASVYETMKEREKEREKEGEKVEVYPSDSSSNPNSSEYYSFSSDSGSPTQKEEDQEYFDHYRKYLVDRGKTKEYIKDYRKQRYSQKEAQAKAEKKLDKEATKLVKEYKREQAKAAYEDSNVSDLATRVANLHPYSTTPPSSYAQAPTFKYAELPPHRAGVPHPQDYGAGYDNYSHTQSHGRKI